MRRFVDPLAEIHFVDQAWAAAVATEIGAVAFDVDGGEIAREGTASCLDALMIRYCVANPPLLSLAEIVRGAETARLDLAPQAAGLHALALGLRATGEDALETLERGFVLCDALYDWARFASEEASDEPMRAGARA
ncbi:MAG: chromate resistance protein [Alphaproteobacteria bacterium]|nr:chromate resistance protein [Alphaproteobacteria bacterium]